MIDLAVVPVAGVGTRLIPASKSQPKEMLPVGRRPVVQYVVEELVASGVQRLLFITGPGKASIENHFDINPDLIQYLRTTGREKELADLQFERQAIDYFYTRQRRQLGLGHAVLCARPFVGEQPFIVALGDSILGRHAQSDVVARMVREFERSGADVVIAFEEVPAEDVVQYGIAKPAGPVTEIFRLADVVEKPSVEEAPSRMAIAARYVFSPRIFEALTRTTPGKGGEIQLTDAIRLLLQEGATGIGLRLGTQERRFDIGNFESYFQAFMEFALTDPEYGTALQGYTRDLLDRLK